MANGLSNGDSLASLSDDALVEIAAALETRHTILVAELEKIAVTVGLEWRKLCNAGVKLGLNAALALAGIISAPVTFGLSLLLTAGSAGMILWDGMDFARDLASHRSNRRQLREIREQADDIEAQLALLIAEMEARTGD